MFAHQGDRLVLRGKHVGMPDRIGVIVDVPHADGTPPYLVRWADDGHESLVYPGPEARVQPPQEPTTVDSL